MNRACAILRPVLSFKRNSQFLRLILCNGSVRTRSYSIPVSAEPFLNGSSSTYVEDMYNAWLRDPTSVHAVRPKFC